MKATGKGPTPTLDRAVAAVRREQPSPEVVAASRARVSERLFGDGETVPENRPIRGCEDVQRLLGVHRRGGLNPARALLVRDHLAECPACRDVWTRRGALRLATTPWQRAVQSTPAPRWNGRRALVTLAAVVTLLVAGLGLRTAFYGVSGGQRATVQAVSGALYRVDGSKAERLVPGATLSDGQVVRAGGSAQSLLHLADGSQVELGERAEFSVTMRGHDTTLQLSRGQIIVQAARRSSGHLYVSTRDCRVAVTGTVFSVMASLKGSRVSVVQGEVHLEQAGRDNVLRRGDQMTTSPALGRVPIEREVAWSRNLDEHLALLSEMAQLRKQWETVRLPDLRYQSRLLAHAPARTVVYAALPNCGEALTEGYRLLQERLAGSEVLRQWWEKSEIGKNRERLDGLVGKMRELSAYLGEEVVVTVSRDNQEEQLLILAEVKQPGLGKRVASEIADLVGGELPLAIVDQEGVASGALGAARSEGAVLLVTPDLVALSAAPAAIVQLATDLDSGSAGAFAMTPLGERVAQAYQNGVSLLVAADLEQLSAPELVGRRDAGVGSELRTLVFEHKAVSGQTLESGELAFAGPRHGVASWLGEPAPMGSLEFVTAQASAVAVVVAKRPAEVLDDILRLSPTADEALAKLGQAEADSKLRIREDLIEALGGEVAVALDGPLLPQPSWKLVIEVQDAERLERAFEALVGRANQELEKKGEASLLLEHEEVGAHTYHRLKLRDAKVPFEAHYAFVGGYLVVTPSRPLLTRAIETRSRGETLARSSRFLSLLPRDGQANLSALLFQDLGRVLAPALEAAGQAAPTPEQKQALDKLLSQSKPSLVGFYGEEDRIEMASVGGLLVLSPEALALPGLIRSTFPGAPDALGRAPSR